MWVKESHLKGTTYGSQEPIGCSGYERWKLQTLCRCDGVLSSPTDIEEVVNVEKEQLLGEMGEECVQQREFGM